MRTIKFRGKSLSGEWLYGYLQKYQETHASRLCICAASVRTWKDALLYEVNPDTIGQFTGSYDINGKEIYEGDIVKAKDPKRKYKEVNYCVVFNRGRPLIGGGAMEVVGNIYDNPELEKDLINGVQVLHVKRRRKKMYYKIVNKESEVYKRLREQREKEMEADKRNKAKIEELLGFKWKAFYGRCGYQNLWRVTTYTAFVPEEGSKITNVVRPSSIHEDAYEPNRRSKAGKALSDFLSRGMETFHFVQVLNILGVKRDLSRFKIPFMAIKDDVILLYLDEDHRPTVEDVVEITSKEFEELLKKEEQ